MTTDAGRERPSRCRFASPSPPQAHTGRAKEDDNRRGEREAGALPLRLAVSAARRGPATRRAVRPPRALAGWSRRSAPPAATHEGCLVHGLRSSTASHHADSGFRCDDDGGGRSRWRCSRPRRSPARATAEGGQVGGARGRSARLHARPRRELKAAALAHLQRGGAGLARWGGRKGGGRRREEGGRRGRDRRGRRGGRKRERRESGDKKN